MTRQKKTADRPDISVQTVPNGYSLTVDGQKYMYFNALALVEGMFVHVGLKIGDDMNLENISDLITACATWPKEGDAIREAVRLSKRAEELAAQRDRDNQCICELTADKKAYYSKVQTLQSEVRDLRKRLEAIAKAIRDVGKPAKAETPDETKNRGRKPAEKNPIKVSRVGGRAKADAAILAEMEQQARESGNIK